MAGERCDAIVIGAGPNGLVAANQLADRGWDVLVLEANAEPGGGVQSAELIEPGYVHDVCSAFYPFAPLAPALVGLNLAAYGLRWCRAPVVLAHPSRDGTCPILSTDLDETAASLDALGPGDGDAWRRLFELWQRVRDPLVATLLGPFPPVRATARLAATVRGDLVRFARFALVPVRRFGEERFTGEPARRLIAGTALHADLAPENTLSGFYGWLMCMLGQDVGFPVPEGGAGALTAALVRRLEATGGVLRCGAPVERVVVEHGRAVGVRLGGGELVRARRAVLADVDAVALYRRLVGEEHVPPSLRRDLTYFQRDRPTFKVDWTLDGPIPWTAAAARRAGTVHLTDSIDTLSASENELVRGVLPADPFLIVGQQSMTDPSRQPPGKETAWAYTHVPAELRGDAAGELRPPWTAATTAALVERIEGSIEARAPGFRALIRGRHVLDPHGLEAHDANLVGGAIAGGTSQLHQQLVFRPVPGLGRPVTPVTGLFLASSSAHPGGGVHGAPGSNAAHAALAHARRRRGLDRLRR